MKRAIVAFLAVLAWSGARQARAVLLPVNSNTVVQDGIEYYIQTDKAVYDLGEVVEILYRVSNLTDEIVDLGKASYIRYWCTVRDREDVEIWGWPRVAAPRPPGSYILDPLDIREYDLTWNLMNDAGTYWEDDDTLITPGSYRIVVGLSLWSVENIVPVSLSVEVIPEPTTVVMFTCGSVLIMLARNRRKTIWQGGSDPRGRS